MKRNQFSDEQILAIVKEGKRRRKMSDPWPTQGITEQTYYGWKAKVGGLELSEMQRLTTEGAHRRLQHSSPRQRPRARDPRRPGSPPGWPQTGSTR